MFKFYINNIEVEEPIGWDEAKRAINRSKKYKGLFNEYIINLTFHGDGYDEIKRIINDGISPVSSGRPNGTGYCQSIPFKITKRCTEFDPYNTYFEGYITTQNAKEDEVKCTIKVDAEDNSLTAILINRSDYKVKFDSTTSVNGTAISLPTRTIAVYNSNTSTWVNRTGYYITDVFQFILDYISDSQIDFASNLFNTNQNLFPGVVVIDTDSMRLYQNIKFNTPSELTGSGNILINYTNYFGEAFQAVVPKQGSAAATLNRAVYELNGDSSGATNTRKFYDQNLRKFANVYTDGVDEIGIATDFRFYISSITGAATTITNQNIQESESLYSYQGVNSMRKLSMMSVGQLRNANSIPNMSFDELFEELDKILNLGMSLTLVNGTPTLRIEQSTYFQQQPNAIELENVPSIISEVSKSYSFNSITSGEGSDKVAATGNVITNISKDMTFNVAEACIGSKLDIKNKFIIDWDDIDSLITHTSDERDEKNVFLECVDTVQAGAVAETKTYRYRTYTNTSGSSITNLVKNINLSNIAKIRNWLPNIPGDVFFENGNITNYTDKKIKEYDIEYPLTDSEYNTIKENMFNFISFNKGVLPGDEHRGWIIGLQREEKSGKTKFKLLGK